MLQKVFQTLIYAVASAHKVTVRKIENSKLLNSCGKNSRNKISMNPYKIH